MNLYCLLRKNFFFLHRIVIGILLATGFCGYADAQPIDYAIQTSPTESGGNPSPLLADVIDTETSDSPSNINPQSSGALSHLGDFKAGVFWGDGEVNVHRHVNIGLTPQLGQTFAAFEHHTDTELDGTFLTASLGFQLTDKLATTTSIETNIGRDNRFKQISEASPGQSSFGNSASSVLFLPADTAGSIMLDENNSIWNWDQSFALSVKPKLQLLAGWKYSMVNSSIDPYSTTVPPFTWETLPGLAGWKNYWAMGGTPSIQGFFMAQKFWWTGPYLGVRFTDGDANTLPGKWYIEGKFAPYVWGRYEFTWDTFLNDTSSAGYIKGSEEADISGMHGNMLEIKSGTQVKLLDWLSLEFWAKYMHLSVCGSGMDMQSTSSSFFSPSFVSQGTSLKVNLTENFWGLGFDLVLPF